MAAAPWSHDDPRLRARLMEALGGTCWWQGELAPMAACYQEALDLWLAIGDEAEIANAYYNASFQFDVPAEADRIDPDSEGDRTGRPRVHRARARHLPPDRRPPRRGQRPVGARQLPTTSAARPGNGEEQFREALAMFREVGDRTMEAWSLHMLGTALLRNGEVAEAREQRRARHPALLRRGRCRRADPHPRRPVRGRGRRGRPAARRPAARRGAQPDDRDRRGARRLRRGQFETGVRPGVRSHMSEDGARALRRRGGGDDPRRGGRLRAGGTSRRVGPSEAVSRGLRASRLG